MANKSKTGGAALSEQQDTPEGVLPTSVAEKECLLPKKEEVEENASNGVFTLAFQDNVQGAVLFACMKTLSVLRDHDGYSPWKLMFSLFVIPTPALLCYAMQAGFIYALYKVDSDAAQAACSVGAWLKLCSIALFFICVYSVTLSALAHTKIIALSVDSACRPVPTKRKHFAKMKEEDALIIKGITAKVLLFLLCVLPEVMITTFMIPVGIIYIFIQQTMETTIIAAVAMLFVIEIDECVYLFFPQELREDLEEAAFNVHTQHPTDHGDHVTTHHDYEHGSHHQAKNHNPKHESIKKFLGLGLEPIIKLYAVILITLVTVYGLRDAWLNCECFVPTPRPDLMCVRLSLSHTTSFSLSYSYSTITTHTTLSS
jgi:hypothetical protein